MPGFCWISRNQILRRRFNVTLRIKQLAGLLVLEAVSLVIVIVNQKGEGHGKGTY